MQQHQHAFNEKKHHAMHKFGSACNAGCDAQFQMLSISILCTDLIRIHLEIQRK